MTSCPGIDPLPSEFCFFKIIRDTTLQEGKIMIPKEFTQKYGGRLLNPLFLKVPNGIEWELCWTKDGVGNVWLDKGWKEFFTYYSLGYGHLVTFKYQQTCTLEVQIYNTNVVQRNYLSNNAQNNFSNVSFEVAPTSPSLPGPSKKPRTHPSGVDGQSFSLPHVQVKVDQLQGNSSGAIRSKTPLSCVKACKGVKIKKTFGLNRRRRRQKQPRRPGSSNQEEETAKELRVGGAMRPGRRGGESVSDSDSANGEKERGKVKIKKKLTESQEDMRRLLEWGANRVREIASSTPFSNLNSNESSFILLDDFKTEAPSLDLNFPPNGRNIHTAVEILYIYGHVQVPKRSRQQSLHFYPISYFNRVSPKDSL
ncbi:hypothetical protein LR48_Vigan06g120700 [Vigna angularis]|uniref:TF-B3 domain-containing protein n=1 Tax=Phaseolus angularis TaxID=3914 RepID=A0A0L9UT49_PHAAN|nr:hypothetical protein LR48_Vigan06g120700 [Vigna angularis]